MTCLPVLAWAIAAVLYVRNRTLWFKWARAIVTLSFSALVVFTIMPAAPPWYAANIEHLIPPVERISTRGLDPIGLRMANELIEQGRAVANDVAAFPSLHTAFAVITALFFFCMVPKRHRFWLRPLLIIYPIAMLAALVYSGEHYVVDGIAGAALATLISIHKKRNTNTYKSPYPPITQNEVTAIKQIAATMLAAAVTYTASKVPPKQAPAPQPAPAPESESGSSEEVSPAPK